MAENFLDGTGVQPISWWLFDDATGPSVDGNTTNANNLNWFNGAPTQDTANKVEGAASMSVPTTADQALRSNATLSANFPGKGATGEFTVGYWGYVPGNMVIRNTINFEGTSSGYRLTTVSTGKFRCVVNGNVLVDLSSDTTITTAGWHHHLVRWNGNNTSGAGANDEVSLWVDGVKQSTTGTMTSLTLNTTSNLNFAGAADGVTKYDEAFVFAVALLDTQIDDIYNHGLDGTRNPVTSEPSALYLRRRRSRVG